MVPGGSSCGLLYDLWRAFCNCWCLNVHEAHELCLLVLLFVLRVGRGLWFLVWNFRTHVKLYGVCVLLVLVFVICFVISSATFRDGWCNTTCR